ncbi:hypothetical protein NCHU2750_01990 [Neorhizobium sp. NCHU2750]|nr:hypothetical protein NCHU2750_01990 [Neorhizobium sp. NCHU2750]
MPVQPSAYFRLLVCRVVVENDVDGFILGQGRFDCIEEANEFLMAVSLHIFAEHRPIEEY